MQICTDLIFIVTKEKIRHFRRSVGLILRMPLAEGTKTLKSFIEKSQGKRYKIQGFREAI